MFKNKKLSIHREPKQHHTILETYLQQKKLFYKAINNDNFKFIHVEQRQFFLHQ